MVIFCFYLDCWLFNDDFLRVFRLKVLNFLSFTGFFGFVLVNLVGFEKVCGDYVGQEGLEDSKIVENPSFWQFLRQNPINSVLFGLKSDENLRNPLKSPQVP